MFVLGVALCAVGVATLTAAAYFFRAARRLLAETREAFAPLSGAEVVRLRR